MLSCSSKNNQGKVMFNIPIIYAVRVVDGIGDLLHFIDFVTALPPSLAENAYFFVSYCEDYLVKMIEEPLELYEKNLRNEGYHTQESMQQMIKSRIKFKKEIQVKANKIKGILDNLYVSHPKNPLARNTVYYIQTDLFEAVNSDCLVWNVSTNSTFDNSNIRLIGTLYEHGFFPEHKVKRHPLQQTMGISLNSKVAGIFVKPSDADTQLDETGIILRKRYKISDEAVVNFCYSHSNTEHNINMLIALHKKSKNAAKPQIIVFPQGIPKNLYVALINRLPKENIRLIESLGHTGFNDAEIRQLKIMQAQTAACGLAAGDTSAQDCINEGLLPIIEYERFEKADFWHDMIEVIEDFSTSHLFTKEQQQDVEIIIKYLKDSLEYYLPFAAQRLLVHVEAGGMNIHEIPELISRGITEQPPFIAPPSCAQLTESCFAMWKNEICIYLRKNFNVADRIPAAVQLFRMLGELVVDTKITNNLAVEFFKKMDREQYSQLVNTLKESMHLIRAKPYYSSEEDLQQISNCLLALEHKVDNNPLTLLPILSGEALVWSKYSKQQTIKDPQILQQNTSKKGCQLLPF